MPRTRGSGHIGPALGPGQARDRPGRSHGSEPRLLRQLLQPQIVSAHVLTVLLSLSIVRCATAGHGLPSAFGLRDASRTICLRAGPSFFLFSGPSPDPRVRDALPRPDEREAVVFPSSRFLSDVIASAGCWASDEEARAFLSASYAAYMLLRTVRKHRLHESTFTRRTAGSLAHMHTYILHIYEHARMCVLFFFSALARRSLEADLSISERLQFDST